MLLENCENSGVLASQTFYVRILKFAKNIS